MSKEEFVNARGGFAAIRNSFLDNKKVTLEAKGLLTIFLSNSETWKIQMKEIITRSKNGRDKHYKVVEELIEHGYMCRVAFREKGKYSRVIYIFSDDPREVKDKTEEFLKQGAVIYENPKKGKKQKKQEVEPHPEIQDMDFLPSPHPEKPDTEKPDTVFQDVYKNKYNNTNTNNTNTSMYVGSEPPNPIKTFSEAHKLTKYAIKELDQLIATYGPLLVDEAVKRAINNESSKPIGYTEGILERWSDAGVQTLEDIEAYERKFREEQQKKKKAKQTKPDEKKLPRAVAKQMGSSSQPDPQQPSEDLAEKQARVQAKLKLMNERLSKRKEEKTLP